MAEEFVTPKNSSLYAGIATGTFIKNRDGTWRIGKEGEGGSTSGAGFARYLARRGFDSTLVKPGESIVISENGLIRYRNKTYQPGTPEQIKALEQKVNNLVTAGVIGSARGRQVGGVAGMPPGTKISDVLPPEAWPPGYNWDTPIPEEGIPVTFSSSQLEISKRVLGPFYDSYVKMSGGMGEETDSSSQGFTGTSATGAAFGTTTSNAITNPYLPGTPEFTGFQQRESAYNLLRQQMAAYGLESLVDPLRNLVMEGVSPSEFTIRLRDTAAYKQRFAANQGRIQKGLRALSEAEYIGLEDQYQDVMRRYGLPASYYQRGALGRQEGFEKFISGDVSPVELEDRIQTAYNRVVNANPEVGIALRNFYPSITNGDILAYAMDPDRALQDIQRKITAAEIGGAAVQAGLTTNESDAQYLARYGITKEQAQQGYRTISGYLPRAQQLSSFYQNQVQGGPYTQASAEREVFGVPGAAEEERKRRQITSLEEAAFQGRSGLTGGALARERAGQF